MTHQPSTIYHHPSAIYIHIPFCVRKCLYCDFASYPGMEHLFAPYVEALLKEIRLGAERFPDSRISTIYVGGGTPNVLSPEQLSGIIEEVSQDFLIDADAEITVEANPAVSSANHPITPSPHLFNRLSLGVQSLHDNELKALGRIHTSGEAIQAFEAAREIGFSNISIDLMYGIPLQTIESWRETLLRMLDLGPEHVSLYSLTVEEGTPFSEMCRSGRLELPGSDTEADMYELAIRTLTKLGYAHYEISNFARPGFESRHNTTYWRNEPYFGFGAGASAYLEGIRSSNVNDVEEYIRRLGSGESPIDSQECLTVRQSMGETMFLGLRMLSGVDVDSFRARYGVPPREIYSSEIESLVGRGLIEESDGCIRLTMSGLFLANDVFSEFVG